MPDEDSALNSLKGKIDDEELESLAEFADENRQDWEKSQKLQDLIGLKSFGVTTEGVRSAISLGSQLVRHGQLKKAADYFGALAALEPFHPDVYFWMGLTAHKMKSYDNAYFLYLQAISFGHNDGCAKMFGGECLLMLGNAKEGVELIKNGIAEAGENPKLLKQVQRAKKLVVAQEAKAAK